MAILHQAGDSASRTEPLREQEISSRAACSDEHLYAQWVRRYSSPVYGFLYRMLSSSEDAEDLTQETFFALYQNRTKVRTDVELLPYLFTIARRKAISLIRRRTVRGIFLPLAHEHEQEIACPRFSPADAALQSQQEQIVNQALATLKPKYRAALILRFFEGLSYPEIAQVMRKPEGTVKSWIFRAEKELRRRLLPLVEPERR